MHSKCIVRWIVVKRFVKLWIVVWIVVYMDLFGICLLWNMDCNGSKSQWKKHGWLQGPIIKVQHDRLKHIFPKPWFSYHWIHSWIWLVVYLPLWKIWLTSSVGMMTFPTVSGKSNQIPWFQSPPSSFIVWTFTGGYRKPIYGEKKTCSKPPTRYGFRRRFSRRPDHRLLSEGDHPGPARWGTPEGSRRNGRRLPSGLKMAKKHGHILLWKCGDSNFVAEHTVC